MTHSSTAATPGSTAPPEPLTAPFTAALAQAEKLIAGADFVRSEADLAEGYDYLAAGAAACLRLSGAHGTSHPYFVSSTGPYAKMGLDNPDTLYYHANIEPDAEYLVSGVRGSTVDLSFQVLKGDYTATEVPGGEDAFDDRRIPIAADGSFAIRFGPAKPDAGPDYFALGEGASMLAVREVYGDWTERKGSIRIERVDTVGTAPVEPDLARMRKRYSAAAKMLLTRVHTWFNFPKWFYLDLPVNTLTAPRLTPGGLSTQYSSVGHFDLADDQALVITVPKSDAPYQGFQLGSLWYISLDYVNHQTSLNHTQAQVDPDGMIRMVVSRQDPGIANWIETTGRTRGILQFRWQRTDRPMTEADGPTVSLVPIAEVAQHLPHFADNRIDADGRRDRIAARQRAFAERMLG
ncbi:hypothetical protein [Nocardia asteroides]|uniref:DUF1214 domain-containing protein n=1 Tax=Nocardia asteroides NBRC 15531 TaxID=1110697 RepID=U5EIR0_NOCAS|nr:hypothetical protein [Nocardia asteroides]TLF67167.1 hypothetical protein FEK33_14370 [Nocardia asteroides NBRC 15531]UGT51551.1 hypothetical protein LT345_13820 [Nocardia asteroides]SFM23507.1 hypothetical protein SAMN05444423_102335 [Nocardia asteroides]VEG35553.1 Uncharacterised protein [Nocardia asteroides]GAD86286.1 hypothetical protein NCAST_32_07730 [Nocardia asteroides NBRC 15531]